LLTGRIAAAEQEEEEVTRYAIDAYVRSTNPKLRLRGQVTFHLDKTFRPNGLRVAVNKVKGYAHCDLVSYGTFTLGATLHGHNDITLELDLATLRAPVRNSGGDSHRIPGRQLRFHRVAVLSQLMYPSF
jgi:acetylornithine deacetylase/succinyl-diaminopimelate desuccinylase-like protein